MPFIGRLEGTTVYPGWVSDTTVVTCPKCGEEMYVRGGRDSDRVRHFVHFANDRICTGESPEHLRWKESIFQSLSELELPNQESLFFCQEGVLDVSTTPTDKEIRRADVLLRFGDDHEQFGRGIAIEVQHRNYQKDMKAATFDYLTTDYSVLWVTRRDLADSDFDAAAEIADSDANPLFFRRGAVSSLPEYEEYSQFELEHLPELLDGTQARLSSY